jgi:hypothetical protein
MIRWATINTMTRRLARGRPATLALDRLQITPLLKHVLSDHRRLWPGILI